MEIVPPDNDQFEIYLTIAKFVNNMGYSLTQNLEFGTELSQKIESEGLGEAEIEKELTR